MVGGQWVGREPIGGLEIGGWWVGSNMVGESVVVGSVEELSVVGGGSGASVGGGLLEVGGFVICLNYSVYPENVQRLKRKNGDPTILFFFKLKNESEKQHAKRYKKKLKIN